MGLLCAIEVPCSLMMRWVILLLLVARALVVVVAMLVSLMGLVVLLPCLKVLLLGWGLSR